MDISLELYGLDEKKFESRDVRVDQLTVSQIKDKVTSCFKIPPGYQQLMHDGHKVRVGQPLIIKEGDTIQVSHSLLNRYVIYKEILQKAVQAKEWDRKIDLAKMLRAVRETFDACSFFETYTHYFNDTAENHSEAMRCFNHNIQEIMDSVYSYLGKAHVKILPDIKPGGSNAGFIFTYNQGAVTKKYWLKANETNWELNPDARELVAYLLLKNIGVGPAECLFIPPSTSKSVIYIGTLDEPEFIQARKLTEPIHEVAAVELHLIGALLYLTDLNSENFGLGKDNKLTIVDFSLTKAYQETQCVNFFKTQGRQQPELRKLKDATSERRMEIAKEALRRWKLEENIPLVKKEFDELKINLKGFVICLERASVGVYKYLEAVKWNVEQFSI